MYWTMSRMLLIVSRSLRSLSGLESNGPVAAARHLRPASVASLHWELDLLPARTRR
jgi:hypothetical protein